MVKVSSFTATCVYKKFVKKLYKNKMLIRIIPVIIAEIDMILWFFRISCNSYLFFVYFFEVISDEYYKTGIVAFCILRWVHLKMNYIWDTQSENVVFFRMVLFLR